jgi:hypothetical protein
MNNIVDEKILKRRERERKYYIKNREKILERKGKGYDKRNKKEKIIRKKSKQIIFEMLGNKCCRCGYSNPMALQLDHLLKKEKNEKRKESWDNYIRNPDLTPITIIFKYQILCANCNWIKRVENKEGYQGHKTKK